MISDIKSLPEWLATFLLTSPFVLVTVVYTEDNPGYTDYKTTRAQNEMVLDQVLVSMEWASQTMAGLEMA